MICVCPNCGEDGSYLRKTQEQQGHSYPSVNETGDIVWSNVEWYETGEEYIICDYCNEIIDENEIPAKEA